MKERFYCTYQDGKQWFTKSLVGKVSVYGESYKQGYRQWNPMRSKLCSALVNGLSQMPIRPQAKVLYLGASTGTTVSHVADMVGKDGVVYAVEMSRVCMHKLLYVANKWPNIAPLLCNAQHIKELQGFVSEVDVVFADIADRLQVQIFIKNCDAFLKKGGFGMLCVKSRSMNIAKKPDVIFREVEKTLAKYATIVDKRSLHPFQKDHMLFVIKK